MLTAQQPKENHDAKPYKTSEFLGIILLLTSVFLQRTYPLRIHSYATSTAQNFTGVVLILFGIVALIWTRRELNKFEQPHRVGGSPTTVLVQSGPFSISRNPIYISIILLIIPGVGLLVKNPWVFILLPPTMGAFYLVLIKEEEEYLETVFNEKWREYCCKTPRWI